MKYDLDEIKRLAQGCLDCYPLAGKVVHIRQIGNEVFILADIPWYYPDQWGRCNGVTTRRHLMRCDIVPANETLLGELYVNHLEYKSDIRYQREMRELEEYVKTLKPEEIF